MRFDDARRRLLVLPGQLPAPPRELGPTVLAGPGGEPARLPRWPSPVRDGAALVLVYPDETGEARVLLTERTRGAYRHSGEVSFPGGGVDAGDASPEAAALREAHEEVALDAAAAGVQVVGRLQTIEIRVSGFRLVPVLALAPRAPAGMAPDPREVAAILEVPLRHFLGGAPIEIVEEERDGLRFRYGAYPWGEYRIWGATARVLGQLGAILDAGGPP